MQLRASTLLIMVCVTAAVASVVPLRPASAVPAAAPGCRDPLARGPAVRSCVRFTAGYARFQTAMQAPNNLFEVTSDRGLEVIMFDDYVVISGPEAAQRRVVPRDRFVYAAEAKFE